MRNCLLETICSDRGDDASGFMFGIASEFMVRWEDLLHVWTKLRSDSMVSLTAGEFAVNFNRFGVRGRADRVVDEEIVDVELADPHIVPFHVKGHRPHIVPFHVPLTNSRSNSTGLGYWLLITEFIKEGSPFCLTRAITRTMIGLCYTPLSLAPRIAFGGWGCANRVVSCLSFSLPHLRTQAHRLLYHSTLGSRVIKKKKKKKPCGRRGNSRC